MLPQFWRSFCFALLFLLLDRFFTVTRVPHQRGERQVPENIKVTRTKRLRSYFSASAASVSTWSIAPISVAPFPTPLSQALSRFVDRGNVCLTCTLLFVTVPLVGKKLWTPLRTSHSGSHKEKSNLRIMALRALYINCRREYLSSIGLCSRCYAFTFFPSTVQEATVGSLLELQTTRRL